MWVDGWKHLVSYFQWHSCYPQAPFWVPFTTQLPGGPGLTMPHHFLQELEDTSVARKEATQ